MSYYPTLFDRAGVEEWIAANRRRYAPMGTASGDDLEVTGS